MLVLLIRAVILYVLIIFSLRIMGKRQLGELQPGELCITILISNIAALPIEDPNIPLFAAAGPVLVLVAFELYLSMFTLKSRGFRKVLSGSPVIVIENGRVVQHALKQLRFSVDDLMATLRAQNVFNIADVEYAVVETTGTVSVLQKFKAQPVTPEDMKLKGKNPSPPVIIINDGQLIPEAMEVYHITKPWLERTLSKEKQSVETTFLLTVDRDLKYFIVPMQKEKGGKQK